MTTNMKAFLEKIEGNAAALAKLQELSAAVDMENMVATAIEIANDVGCVLERSDFLSEPAQEMDDNELKAVSGGYRTCVCIAGGGGKADEQGNACGCVGYGQGNTVNGVRRCTCLVGGGGNDIEGSGGSNYDPYA